MGHEFTGHNPTVGRRDARPGKGLLPRAPDRTPTAGSLAGTGSVRSAPPSRPPPATLLSLQRSAGNRAVQFLVSRAGSVEVEPPPVERVIDDQGAALGLSNAPTEPENGRLRPDLGGVAEPSCVPRQSVEPATPVPVQRSGGGVLAGIRQRISGIVDGVRSGWDRLGGMARGAFSSVSERTRAAGHLLSTAGRGIVAGVQGGWSRLSTAAQGLSQRLTSGLQRMVGGVKSAGTQLRRALIELDIDTARAAWARIQASMGVVSSWMRSAGASLLSRVRGLWTGLQGRVAAGLRALGTTAQRALTGVLGFAGAARQRLSQAWEGLGRGARGLAEFTGIPRVLRAVVSGLLSFGRRLWAGLQSRWQSLRQRCADLDRRAHSALRAGWDRVGQSVVSVRSRVAGLWTRLRGGLSELVSRLGRGVSSAWSRVRSYAAGSVFGKLAGAARLVREIRRGVSNPMAALAPLTQGVTSQLQAGMPACAVEEADARLGRGGATEHAPAPAAVPVQRQVADGVAVPAAARSTAYGSILDSIHDAIVAKWRGVQVGQLVVHVLKSLLWPWPAVGSEFAAMWNDWRTTAGSLFALRTTGVLDFLHDLWTNLLHLLDFPLILVRRLLSVLTLLMGWITLGLVILGAVGGTVAGTVIGGIASAAVSVGLAAPAGAAAGAGAGGGAGALAGLGTALAVGQGLLIAFLAVEAATLVKTFADLLTGRQTGEEKVRDFNQVADSLIGIAVAGVLYLLSFIGARMGSAVMRGLRRIALRLKGSGPAPAHDAPGSTRPPALPARTMTLRELMGEARYAEYEAAINALKAEHPRLRNIPTDDLIAIRGYTDNDWARLNTALRTQDPVALAEVQAQVRHATSGLRSLPSHEGVVTRTVGFSDDMIAGYRPGEIVVERGFTSTTAGGSVGSREGNVLMMITSRTGKDVRLISRFPLENEVLFLPGTRFRVVSVDRVGSGAVIRMVEVP